MLLWGASTTGCRFGWRRTTDPAPPGGDVTYVRRGYIAPPEVESVLRIADAGERAKAFAEQARPIEDRFIVPGPVFLWLMKQAAEDRRLKAETGR